MDVLSLFDEDLSPTMDIVVENLDYTRNPDELEPQGTFSFKKFKIISFETNVELNNTSHFYDSRIYRRGRLIGFQGPAAKFVYRLREEDFKYLDSFKWLKMETVSLFMDRKSIKLSGENFAMREPKTILLTNNFNMLCSRHPGYPLNDGDGFLAGCLNYGEVRPLEGQEIGMEFKLLEGGGNKAIDLKGVFKYLKLEKNRVSTDVTSLLSNFNDKVIVDATEIQGSCFKEDNVTMVTTEGLVEPCLSNLSAQGRFLVASFLEENHKMSLTKPDITNIGNELTLGFEDIIFNSNETRFKMSSSSLHCKTSREEDPIEVETYLKGCLNESELFTEKQNILFEFDTATKDQTLTLKGDLKKLKLFPNRVQLLSENTALEVNDNLQINFKGIDLSCQKEEGLNRFNAKDILSFCKKDLEIELQSFSLKGFEDKEKPILAKTAPDLVSNKDDLLNLNLPELKLVDREDLTLMENVRVLCETKSEEDIFIPNEVIQACVKAGKIEIENLYTTDSTYTPAQIMDPNLLVDKIRFNKSKPSLYNISIIAKGGNVFIRLDTKVLGLNSSVSFSGPINWDIKKEELTIKVTKSRLPLGIKSEKVFMFFLKKMFVAEMISYEKNNVIKISL